MTFVIQYVLPVVGFAAFAGRLWGLHQSEKALAELRAQGVEVKRGCLFCGRSS